MKTREVFMEHASGSLKGVTGVSHLLMPDYVTVPTHTKKGERIKMHMISSRGRISNCVCAS